MKIDKAWHDIDIVVREVPRNRHMKSMVMLSHSILHGKTVELVLEHGTAEMKRMGVEIAR